MARWLFIKNTKYPEAWLDRWDKRLLHRKGQTMVNWQLFEVYNRNISAFMNQEWKYWFWNIFSHITLPNPHKMFHVKPPRTLLATVKKTWSYFVSNWIALIINVFSNYNFLFLCFYIFILYIAVEGWCVQAVTRGINSSHLVPAQLTAGLQLHCQYQAANTLKILITRSLFFPTLWVRRLRSHFNNWNETLLNLKLCKKILKTWYMIIRLVTVVLSVQ